MGTWDRDGQKKKKLAQTVSFVCLFKPFWNKREKPDLACFLLVSLTFGRLQLVVLY